MVEEGSFRSDLYFRLKVIEIKMPELKAHRQDIPLLCSHFIHHYNQQQGKKRTIFNERSRKNSYDIPFPW